MSDHTFSASQRARLNELLADRDTNGYLEADESAELDELIGDEALGECEALR